MKPTIAIMILAAFVSCSDIQSPPAARKIPYTNIICDTSITDYYYWMRLSDEQKTAGIPDAQTMEVLEFLKSENSYAEQVFKERHKKLNKLYHSLKSRTIEEETSFPYFDNGYFYYTKTLHGKNYPAYFRQKDGVEEMYLDVNKLAEGKQYCKLSSISISPDNRYLLFCADFVGRNQYTIYIMDLEKGDFLPDSVKNSSYSAEWGADSKTIYYVGKDKITLRSDKVYRHTLYSHCDNDELLYFEEDPTYNMYLSKSSDKKYVFINCDNTLSDEVLFLDSANGERQFQVFYPRRKGVKYKIDHNGERFYIMTNIDGAKDYKIMECRQGDISYRNWKETVPEKRGSLMRDFKVFNNYIAINEIHEANACVKIIDLSTLQTKRIDLGSECYSSTIGINNDVNTDKLRIEFSSMITPPSIYEYDMREGTIELLYRTPVPNYDPSGYEEERLWAKAKDGTMIPLSVIHSKNFVKNGKGKVLLYGYGAYGSSSIPDFDSDVFSLIDEGFVYAIAHVRGGSEMGNSWYENGMMLNKKNSFTDLNDCARYLIEEQYTTTDMFCYGASAGGLLVTAAVNMEPDLYKGAIAGVPFTDVITTMADETIPLTTFEWEEWGDPRKEPYFSYMLSYSPYDNIKRQKYPNMLVTSGFWDSQVQYWEPAKWVAKLREYKTDDNLLLFICDMTSGHGGASGRYDRLMKKAKEYLFLCSLCK